MLEPVEVGALRVGQRVARADVHNESVHAHDVAGLEGSRGRVQLALALTRRLTGDGGREPGGDAARGRSQCDDDDDGARDPIRVPVTALDMLPMQLLRA